MKYDFLLVLLVVSISGNPALFTLLEREPLYVCTLIIFIIYWLFVKPIPLRLNKRTALIFLGLGTLFALHYLAFGSIVLMASMGFMVILLIAFFAVKLIPDFFRKYISVMAWLGVLSLIFHIPRLLGVNMASIFSFLRAPGGGSNYSHIYIHNFHYVEEMRNSGIFWEPGAFAGYLVIALLLVLAHKHTPTSKWKVIVLIAALVSTQSTTGYMAGFFIFSYWQLSKYRGRSVGGLDYRFIIIPFLMGLIITASIYSYSSIAFLGEKIEHQISESLNEEHNYRFNRFGNYLYDIDFLMDRPLTGWGASPQTRVSVDPELADFIDGQGNGLSGFLVKFGLIAFFVYFYSLFKNLKSMTHSTNQALILTVPILMLLMGEQFLDYALFLTLAFVSTSSNLSVDNIRRNLSSKIYPSFEKQQ